MSFDPLTPFRYFQARILSIFSRHFQSTMPRAQERGRSRTRRGKSRSWSPPNPRFSRDVSPGSRDVIHYSGVGRAQWRNKARSPSPLTNATSFGDTAGESETEAGNFTSDDDSTRQKRHTPKKDKSVWFKNRKYEGDHIAGKVSDLIGIDGRFSYIARGKWCTNSTTCPFPFVMFIFLHK